MSARADDLHGTEEVELNDRTRHHQLLAQLRTLLDLTNTEIQIAETRVTQARTDAVRRELRRTRRTAASAPKPSRRLSAISVASPTWSARSWVAPLRPSKR